MSPVTEPDGMAGVAVWATAPVPSSDCHGQVACWQGWRIMVSWAKSGDAVRGDTCREAEMDCHHFRALVFTNTGDADVASYHACRLRKNPRRNRQRKVVTEWPFLPKKRRKKNNRTSGSHPLLFLIQIAEEVEKRWRPSMNVD